MKSRETGKGCVEGESGQASPWTAGPQGEVQVTGPKRPRPLSSEGEKVTQHIGEIIQEKEDQKKQRGR